MALDAQTLAFVLLSFRLAAAGMIIAVLAKQIKNIRTLHTDYPAVRMAVLILTITLLVGQVIPIILDTIVAYGSTYKGRSTSPSALGASYALNNAIKDVIIGSLLTFLYYRPSVRR